MNTFTTPLRPTLYSLLQKHPVEDIVDRYVEIYDDEVLGKILNKDDPFDQQFFSCDKKVKQTIQDLKNEDEITFNIAVDAVKSFHTKVLSELKHYNTLNLIPYNNENEIKCINVDKEKTDERYCVEPSDDDYGDEFYSVDGLDDNQTRYAIEFTPWKELLNYPVNIESIEKYGELDCICAIYWEMTFMGYTEEDVIEKYSDIMNSYDECLKNVTDIEDDKE